MIRTTLAPGAPWPSYGFAPRQNAPKPRAVARNPRGVVHPIKTYLAQNPGSLAEEISQATGYCMSVTSSTLNGYCRTGTARKVKSDTKNCRGMKLLRFYLNDKTH